MAHGRKGGRERERGLKGDLISPLSLAPFFFSSFSLRQPTAMPGRDGKRAAWLVEGRERGDSRLRCFFRSTTTATLLCNTFSSVLREKESSPFLPSDLSFLWMERPERPEAAEEEEESDLISLTPPSRSAVSGSVSLCRKAEKPPPSDSLLSKGEWNWALSRDFSLSLSLTVRKG